MYGKSKKGYFKAKDPNQPAMAGEPANAAAAAGVDNTAPVEPDPLAQFASQGDGKSMSFTQAGFKRGYSSGGKDLYVPNKFGEGGSQIVNVDGQDYTIAFTKDKTGDKYNAVLVDAAGNVRSGSTRDQAINDMLSNFQNLSGSQVARSLYEFGISKTSTPAQGSYRGAMGAVQGVAQGAQMP